MVMREGLLVRLPSKIEEYDKNVRDEEEDYEKQGLCEWKGCLEGVAGGNDHHI